ncbi:MAG: efflux transporter outer membrane subunit [Planctomycetota bacterium]
MSAAATLVLAACAGTPPPAAEVELPTAIPAAWQAPGATAEAAPAAAAAPLPERWWTQFGDARLDACVDAALQHNQDLAAAAARVLAAHEQAVIAGAPRLPQLDASFDAARSRRVFVGFPFGGGGVPSSTTTTFGLGLNASWELDVWGRLRAAEGAALAAVQAEAADFAGARQSLIAQTCKAYFALVEARQQRALAEATVTAFAATAEDVRDRFRRGVRPALDTMQADGSLQSAQADVARRRQQEQVAARQLEVLLGRYPAARQDSAAVLSTDLPAVPAGLPSELLGRRADLAAAERRLAAAGCRVDAARAALYPRLSLTASGGTNSEELGDLLDDAFRVWTLGANLLQPLFHGGALRAEAARTEAERLQALFGYGGALLRAFAEVEDALAASAWLRDQQQAAAAAATSAAGARDLARERYQLGLIDFLAVLDGQQRAFTAESARIAVLRQQLDNRVELILALGGGFAAQPPRVLPPRAPEPNEPTDGTDS